MFKPNRVQRKVAQEKKPAARSATKKTPATRERYQAPVDASGAFGSGLSKSTRSKDSVRSVKVKTQHVNIVSSDDEDQEDDSMLVDPSLISNKTHQPLAQFFQEQRLETFLLQLPSDLPYESGRIGDIVLTDDGEIFLELLDGSVYDLKQGTMSTPSEYLKLPFNFGQVNQKILSVPR